MTSFLTVLVALTLVLSLFGIATPEHTGVAQAQTGFQPTLELTASTANATVGAEVEFTVVPGVVDANGDPVAVDPADLFNPADTIVFDFGDGDTVTWMPSDLPSTSAKHYFEAAGEYTVSATWTSGVYGATVDATVDVAISTGLDVTECPTEPINVGESAALAAVVPNAPIVNGEPGGLLEVTIQGPGGAYPGVPSPTALPVAGPISIVTTPFSMTGEYTIDVWVSVDIYGGRVQDIPAAERCVVQVGDVAPGLLTVNPFSDTVDLKDGKVGITATLQDGTAPQTITFKVDSNTNDVRYLGFDPVTSVVDATGTVTSYMTPKVPGTATITAEAIVNGEVVSDTAEVEITNNNNLKFTIWAYIGNVFVIRIPGVGTVVIIFIPESLAQTTSLLPEGTQVTVLENLGSPVQEDVPGLTGDDLTDNRTPVPYYVDIRATGPDGETLSADDLEGAYGVRLNLANSGLTPEDISGVLTDNISNTLRLEYFGTSAGEYRRADTAPANTDADYSYGWTGGEGLEPTEFETQLTQFGTFGHSIQQFSKQYLPLIKQNS
ncbi:MAG: hypothetical protein HC837_02285 [Chloroflexaceae bacterium]|nr:hypothetical protein [Chloroflexaceae bacterium]